MSPKLHQSTHTSAGHGNGILTSTLRLAGFLSTKYCPNLLCRQNFNIRNCSVSMSDFWSWAQPKLHKGERYKVKHSSAEPYIARQRCSFAFGRKAITSVARAASFRITKVPFESAEKSQSVIRPETFAHPLHRFD